MSRSSIRSPRPGFLPALAATRSSVRHRALARSVSQGWRWNVRIAGRPIVRGDFLSIFSRSWLSESNTFATMLGSSGGLKPTCTAWERRKGTEPAPHQERTSAQQSRRARFPSVFRYTSFFCGFASSRTATSWPTQVVALRRAPPDDRRPEGNARKGERLRSRFPRLASTIRSGNHSRFSK